MSSLSKNTFREILHSPGRFLAILAIIVLGSGFFVGLRVSQKAMTATADTYLDKTGFYDFSIATTLGLTDAEVETLLADPDVADAEGSFETDALVDLGGSSDLVFAFYSLPERINVPDLVEGRLPTAPDECLADAWTDLEPGDRITVSSENDPETLERFAVRTFTVTGTATSPLYLNFERGSTSLGAGTVTAFCYVPRAALDADYYTGVYLRCHDMPRAYTGDYDERSTALEDHFTDLADRLADARYASVTADAEAELADGWAEYNDALATYESERADAEAELADALSELEDAKAELEDAARQIADGKAELSDGERTLADSERTLADSARALDEAKAELDDAAGQIADGWREYDEGLAAFESRRADGEQEIAKAEAELADALGLLEEGEAEYADNLKLYEEGEAEYAEGEARIASSERALEENERLYSEGLAAYNEALEAYNAGMAELEAAKAALEENKALLDDRQAQFDALMAALLEGINEQLPAYGLPPYASVDDLLAAAERGDFIAVFALDQALKIAAERDPDADIPADTSALLAVRDALAAGWDAYNAAMAEYEANADYLAGVYAQLDEARNTLEATRRELDAGWVQLEVGKRTLADSRAALDDARRQLEEGRARLDESRAEYDSGMAELDDARAELASSVAEADAQFAQARAALEESEAKYAEGLAEYEKGLADYEDGVRQYNDGKEQLARSEQDLADAEARYDDGKAQYEEGLAAYNDSRAEADGKFAEAEAELADARAELDSARREIDGMERPGAYLMGRWSNLGYVCFENDTSIVRSISSVFPLFFFLVAALICVTTVSRMVEEQRSQLGVLMALGYSRLKVMGKFLVYSGSASVIGCTVGILLGSRLIPLVIWQAYRIMYSFSDTIEFYFDVPLSVVTFALYLAAMMTVTWLSCRREVSDVPANVIRPRPPKAGKRVMLERVPLIWNRLSFLWKVTVRNIFRYKLRVLMMILGVAGCTALMLTGMGINDSIRNVVDYQFTEISLYDYTVTFAQDLSEGEREEFLQKAGDFAEDALFLHQSTVTAVSGRSEKEVQLSAVDAGGLERIDEFMDFHRGAKKLPFPQKGEALINLGLARAMGLSVGDALELRGEDGSSVTVTVSGVYDNYIYNTVYISSDTLPGEPEINYALVLKNASADTGEALAEILGMDNVLTASASLDMRARIGNMMASLIYIVLLTVICAAALAFVVIYNLTNINIQERLREIATVKVLGFYDFESALYVLRENILLTLLGAAAGIPLGLALNAFVIGQIKLDIICFTPRVAPVSYLASVALTILFSLLVDLFMLRRLNTISPASALKAAE